MFQEFDNIEGCIVKIIKYEDIMKYLIKLLIDKYGCVFDNYYHIVEIYTRHNPTDDNYHLYFSNGTFNFEIYHYKDGCTYIRSENYEYGEDIISKIVSHFGGGSLYIKDTAIIIHNEEKEYKEQMENPIINEPLYYSNELRKMGIGKDDNFIYGAITDECIDKNITFDRLKLSISIFDHFLKMKNNLKINLKKTSIGSFIDENDYFKTLYTIMSQLISLKKINKFVYKLKELPYEVSLILINDNRNNCIIEFDDFVKDNDKIICDIIELYKQLTFIETKKTECKPDIENYKNKLADEILDLNNPNSMFNKYINEKHKEAMKFEAESISKLNNSKNEYVKKCKKVVCINDNDQYLLKKGYIYYTPLSIEYSDTKNGKYTNVSSAYFIDECLDNFIGIYPVSYFEEVIDNEEDVNSEDTY